MAWLHPSLATERLELLRSWSLRIAEQSREYGEPEEEWAGCLDTADRASDLIDLRRQCHSRSAHLSCSVLRMRATAEEREKRSGCFFPLCLISINRPTSGRIQFHHT